MKFYMVVNYYVVSLSFKLYEDPCIFVRARVVKARARFIAIARVYDSCTRICAWIFKKFET